MAVDADGSPILMPAKVLKQISGESIEPEECRAVLGKQTFEPYTACILSGIPYLPRTALCWNSARLPINAAVFKIREINKTAMKWQETEVTNENHKKI